MFGRFCLDIATFLVVITILESASAQICAIGTYAGVGSSDVGYFSGDKGDALSAKMSLEVYGGVSVDTSMKMFIGDYTNNRVRVVNPDTKIIDTIAGSSLTSFSGEGGQATTAGVPMPTGICTDTTGTLYIPTGVYRVVKVDTSGIISNCVGNGVMGNTGDAGPATSATINDPRNCVLDSSANVYFSVRTSYVIRMMTISTKIITRYAGTGSSGTNPPDGGPATSASVSPQSIFMDSTGNMYCGDSNYLIRKIAAGTNTITRFAGNGGSGSVTGMGGLATSASIPGSSPVVVGDSLGNIFIGSSNRLYRVDATTNIIKHVAGTGGVGDKAGDCTSAQFGAINQVAVFNGDTTNSVYVPTGRNTVRRVFLQFAPTAAPSYAPSLTPTGSPSMFPSFAPSVVPSEAPTIAPGSTSPSQAPSLTPTAEPSVVPTLLPSVQPTFTPTAAPSQMPTLLPSASPSLSPSCVPRAAPSQGPSIAPTAAPVPPTEAPTQIPTQSPTTAAPGTVAPTLAPSETPSLTPSTLPSVLPTAQPTQTRKPTAAFTVKPSPQITAPPTASFDGIAVDQPVVIKYVRKGATVDRRRLSLDLLDGSSRNALVSAAASVMILSVSAVSIADEYLVDTNSTTGLSRIAVTFRFLVQDSDFPQQSFGSPRALFTFVTTGFAQSISGFAFDTALSAAAVEYHAAELFENAQQDPTVTVAPPTYTEVDTYDPMDAGLSTGEYAGVVIGVLVGFIVLGVIVLLLFKRRIEESAHSAVPTSQV